ncbi:organic cation transporter protein-like [Tubulanus polymorphus]|uniref:organic cation transporter protein-like n=1 Tax=Tubulanus polymorphus TaxID=672921 RepID=UPI003DA1D7ED
MQDIDRILALLGNPGKYQAFLMVLLASNFSYMAFNNMIMAIYGASNPFHCKLPNNVTVEEAIPYNNAKEKYDSCTVYANFSNTTNKTVSCPNGYQFNAEPGELSIVMEWNLVCDKLYLAKLVTTLYFLGVMVGGVIFGSLSDRYGRKPVLMFTLWMPALLGVALSFVQHLTLFILIRFVMGLLLQGMQAITCTLVLELSQKKHRTFAGTIMEVMWSVGGMYLAFICYLVRDWHYIQLVLGLHSLVTVAYFWLVPESIRWLFTHSKYKKLEETVNYLAKLNCMTLSKDPICEIDNDEEDHVEPNTEIHSTEKPKGQSFFNIIHMFRTTKMRKRSLILFYIWFANSTAYYGLMLNVSTLAGNKYLNFFIMSAVDLPAYLLCMAILGKVGRKRPLSVFLLFGGLLCIAAAVVPHIMDAGNTARIISTVLALLGKFGIAGGFGVLFMYTSELFPTVVRNVGVGSCAFMARFGALISPQILLLGFHTFTSLPTFLFGVFAVIGSGISVLLPETLHKPMPDTIADVEQVEEKLMNHHSTNQLKPILKNAQTSNNQPSTTC